LFGIVVLIWAIRWITKEHHPYRWRRADGDEPTVEPTEVSDAR
jgi:hypothetical protein